MKHLQNLNLLYLEIKGGNNDELYLFCGEGEEPTYGSDSLFDKYDDCETNDTKIIFEEAPKDFKMSDKDKQYLWKLLTDFSIEKFLNTKQDADFINFLWKYNFRIGIIGE